jgi:uncharacterized protein YgiM (DUF1202 family)
MVTRWLRGCVAALALFVAGATVAESAPQDPPFRGKVTGSNVNIRMGPGRTGLIVRVAAEGESLIVTGREGTWYRIVPPKNAWCWIRASNVKKTESGTIVKRATILREDSRVNARALGQAESGDEIRILSEKVDWYKIQAPRSVSMYIHADYVSFDRAYDRAKDGPIPGVAGKEKEDPATAAGGKEAPPKAADPVKTREDRDAELRKLKAEYERINKEYQEEVQRIAKERDKPRKKNYDASGVVDTVGLFLGRPGTHALISGKKIVCYLKSADPEKINLNRYYGRYVGVIGKSEAARGFEPLQVITVQAIDIQDRE